MGKTISAKIDPPPLATFNDFLDEPRLTLFPQTNAHEVGLSQIISCSKTQKQYKATSNYCDTPAKFIKMSVKYLC